MNELIDIINSLKSIDRENLMQVQKIALHKAEALLSIMNDSHVSIVAETKDFHYLTKGK